MNVTLFKYWRCFRFEIEPYERGSAFCVLPPLPVPLDRADAVPLEDAGTMVTP